MIEYADFFLPWLFGLAPAQSAASELYSTAASNCCRTPLDPQVASPVSVPVTTSCSITQLSALTSDAFQSPMSSTSSPLRQNTTMDLQLDSTSQLSAGRNSITLVRLALA